MKDMDDGEKCTNALKKSNLDTLPQRINLTNSDLVVSSTLALLWIAWLSSCLASGHMQPLSPPRVFSPKIAANSD